MNVNIDSASPNDRQSTQGQRNQQRCVYVYEDSNSPANLFHIVASLCTCLNEHDIQFLCLSLSFLHGDLPLVLQVSFVADQHDDDIIASLSTYILNPFVHLLK